MAQRYYPDNFGLYDSRYEHDSCGVGFVVNVDGRRSHTIVQQGMQILVNLEHRGAIGGEANTGDGAGMLMQIPHDFMAAAAAACGITLPAEGRYGAGMVFLPQNAKSRTACEKALEKAAAETGLEFLGWRDVPVNPDNIGVGAKRTLPVIRQFFTGSGGAKNKAALDRRLYVMRRSAENAVNNNNLDTDTMFYVCSLSCRTIVYKGLLLATQFPQFYHDLQDDTFVSALALVHQRYSTNTFPTWPLAQPFRLLAHNGEINTLRGNINHMRSRSAALASPLFGDDIHKLAPVIDERGSDSSCLDNVAELLARGGRELQHVIMMMIPEAWGVKYPMGPDKRGFFEFHSMFMEPWDGPAAVAFSDGEVIGGMLDRNGLRPARYVYTKSGTLVLASEIGVLDFPDEVVAEKGRLSAGSMILIDTRTGRFMKDVEIKGKLARRQPYRRWVEENRIQALGLFDTAEPARPDYETLLTRQQLFGYTHEDLKMIIGPMAEEAHEPVGSMGADSPLAVLSEKPQMLYYYFKQLFAQVTNPPIDPIREELVMSLRTYIGREHNLLEETPRHAEKVMLQHPILTASDLNKLRGISHKNFKTVTLGMHLDSDELTGAGLAAGLKNLCDLATARVKEGYCAIILSDRECGRGRIPIPALLAVAAVNSHLVREGVRAQAGLIVETGEAREVMHFALLLGYGATAVNPYLALETVAAFAEKGQLGQAESPAGATINYITAVKKGLLKVFSKMGISTLRSYRAAQIFEAVGISGDVIEAYFPGTASRIGGIGLDGIVREALMRYERAYPAAPAGARLLEQGGFYAWRRDGERHLWTATSITNLQQATRKNDYRQYRQYADEINEQNRSQSTLRGLFEFKKAANPLPLDKVEPASEIVKRFVTGAMSFGSISREAHEAMAIAMNRLGGKSNSGEGGEDPERFKPLPNGDSRCSAIKQIASGRFGVTAEYLANAIELQIKMAQGAKPGEGGQLPGHKVNEVIARVRHSTPGVTLISPPPHHDIYSIEDLAQLIFDLKNANPAARISVKLVSEMGVGTVAAGVSKAHADMVLISGFDGGTGASPLSSIRHAGIPWEIGLAETQQTLVLNKLRGRIRVQVDGQMKTGRDVVIGALLGAEEYGFATTALVVLGCVMMRKCHKNTCPVGVATQDERLRKNFGGTADYLVNFFTMVAEEAREIMARLGVATIDDLVGRVDLLETRQGVEFWKAQGLDFSRIFTDPLARAGEKLPVRCVETQDHGIGTVLDRELIALSQDALEKQKKVVIEKPIRNVNRTIGTMLSGVIAKKYGAAGLPDGTIHCRFTGAAGQSFGAFCSNGLTLELSGDANDYLGKGASGGRIIVYPPAKATYDPAMNTIVGNVALYGATGGEVFINGMAGERFCIRNSGALAVAEGIGDHGCEYMTGGRVVILGKTGLNFAAGMSGGLAYVFDRNQSFDACCNLDMVDLEPVVEADDIAFLKQTIEKHVQYTGSARGREILENWNASLPLFLKVFPMEYRRVLGKMMKADEETERAEVVHG